MSTSSEENLQKEREYHHGDLRKALVEAAVELLREKSINDLSLREVARHAGVSAAAPYRHFPSKEALLAAVAAWGFRRLSSGIDATQVPQNVDDMVQRGWAYLDFAEKWPNVYRTMFGGWIKDMREFPELEEAANDSFHQLVASLEAAGVGGENPMRAAIVVWCFAHGFASLKQDGLLQWDDQFDGMPCPTQAEILMEFETRMFRPD